MNWHRDNRRARVAAAIVNLDARRNVHMAEMAEYRERLRRTLARLGARLRNGTSAIARRYLRRADAAESVGGATRVGAGRRHPWDVGPQPYREGWCSCIDGRAWVDCGIREHREAARQALDAMAHGRRGFTPLLVEHDELNTPAELHALDHGTSEEREHWSVGKYLEHLAAHHGMSGEHDLLRAGYLVVGPGDYRRLHQRLHREHADALLQDGS